LLSKSRLSGWSLLVRWEQAAHCFETWSFVYCVRLGTERREGLLVCASQPGTQHDAAFEHERGRDGAFSSRGGYDHRRGV
jgi:hypothetical protein